MGKSNSNPSGRGFVTASIVFMAIAGVGYYLVKDSTLLPDDVASVALDFSKLTDWNNDDPDAVDAGSETILSEDATDKLTLAMKSKGAVVGYPQLHDARTYLLDGKWFRLHEINTIEHFVGCHKGKDFNQCDATAVGLIQNAIGNHLLACFPHVQNSDGVWNARCSVGTQDLGGFLSESGFGIPNDLAAMDYKIRANIAKSRKAGIWGDSGTVTMLGLN